MTQVFIDALTNVYDRQRFKKFSLEFLNELEITEIAIEVDKPDQKHIDSLTFLGSYEDRENKKLHLLEVKLKTDSKIEQARTMQRNLVAKYLKDHWLDGALVAFYSESSPGWRLSFVKIEYKFDENGKTKEEFTPAKRYSFLVGKDEPTHTAQTQLFPIYNNTLNNPTLRQIEESFGVEKVTKEFFEQYRGLFEDVVKELRGSHAFQSEASKHNIDTESFAKKLLGQIVFLYFLQKKGWLGVPKGRSWGEGDRMFLRNIFDKATSDNKNFFNHYLEILFYDTLNNPRRSEVDPSYSRHFDCRIPFLNGGLFEPQYDWENTTIFLDNSLFSKIFIVFDLYNFTVKEDEPLEKEVAVDPEMLGKVFENLLEENLRKGKGTYYTPREIVHYMCEESLINFLATEVDLTPEDVKKKYFPAYNTIEDEKFEVRDVSMSNKIIDSLASIKVVDPACGSGAFLVGMLQQITQLRYELEVRAKLLGSRASVSTEYEIKKQTIQNCIYGVDIDPGAVDIAKLRLWLSLVVDYELEDIEPLPNLDYKIMQGNSLLEELVLGDTSIKLYDSTAIQGALSSPKMKNLFERDNQIGLFDGDKDKVLKNMKTLQLKYFSTSDTEEKRRLKVHIEKIETDLIEASVKGEMEQLENEQANIKPWLGLGLQKDDVKRLSKIINRKARIIAILNELEKTGTKPFFLWHLHFADVFEEKGGFDVVIANPPYINAIDMKKNIDPSIREAYKKQFQSSKGAYDIYILFFEKGFQLLKNKGVLSFITPNKYLSASYAVGFREYIVNNQRLFKIVDVSRVKVFAEVSAYPLISFFQKGKESDYKITTVQLAHEDVSDFDTKSFKFLVNESIYLNLLPDNIWGFLLSEHFDLVKKIYQQSIPLSEVAQICAMSTASESDEYSKFIYEGKQKDAVKLINTGTINPYCSLWGDDILTNKGKKYLKPFLSLDNSVITTHRKTLYQKKKIIIAKIGLSLEAYFDQEGEYASLNTNCLYDPEPGFTLKYILAYLHSSVFKFIYCQLFGALRMGGGYYQFQAPQLRVIPIIKLSDEEREVIEQSVDKIIQTKHNNEQSFEEKDEEKRYQLAINKVFEKAFTLNNQESDLLNIYYD